MWDRSDVSSALLAKISPAEIAKLEKGMPWTQPGFNTTDVYLSGAQSQTKVNTTGIHYGPPPKEPLGNTTLSYKDANQGQFGDCWAMASMTALAKADPSFVKNSFVPNTNGTVSVRLFDHDGGTHWVTVTPDLPLDSNGNTVGAHGTNGQLWPAYYEKALAQTYQDDTGGADDQHEHNPVYNKAEQGDYGALEWEYNDKAAPYVSGNPADKLGGWDDIKSAAADNKGVIVSTGDPPDTSGAPVGYVDRHVFYVQSVNPDGTITLGNPWGPDAQTVTVNEDQYKKWFGSPEAITAKK